MTVQRSTYIYNVVLNFDAQNSTTLKGNATCQTLKGPKVKDSDSRGVIKCEVDKPVPVTVVIQNQPSLLMNLGNRRIVFVR
jgi:hypothetical protein